jgi:hypothetical protein
MPIGEPSADASELWRLRILGIRQPRPRANCQWHAEIASERGVDGWPAEEL